MSSARFEVVLPAYKQGSTEVPEVVIARRMLRSEAERSAATHNATARDPHYRAFVRERSESDPALDRSLR